MTDRIIHKSRVKLGELWTFITETMDALERNGPTPTPNSNDNPMYVCMALPGEAYRPDDYNRVAKIANEIIMRECNSRQKTAPDSTVEDNLLSFEQEIFKTLASYMDSDGRTESFHFNKMISIRNKLSSLAASVTEYVKRVEVIPDDDDDD